MSCHFYAQLQAGDSKAAVDCCVLLHQWDQALQLAQQYDYPQAEGLLQQYAGHLLEKKKYLEAVELYRKVGKARKGSLPCGNKCIHKRLMYIMELHSSSSHMN